MSSTLKYLLGVFALGLPYESLEALANIFSQAKKAIIQLHNFKNWYKFYFTKLSWSSFFNTLLIWPRLKKKTIELELNQIKYIKKEKFKIRGILCEFWLCEYKDIFSFYVALPHRETPKVTKISIIFKDYIV